MPGSPRKRARRDASSETPSRAPARGKDRPRFEPASADDYRRVEVGITRAAAAAARGKAASTPAARSEALAALGVAGTGSARSDKALLAAATRVKRDEGILAAWALGQTPPTIATTFGLSSEHVNRVVDAHRERRARLPLPASSELLLDALAQLEAQMERLTLLAGDEKRAESARVGAVRTWREMWISRLELLQAMGHVTVAPSADARLERARDLLRHMLDALRSEGVSQDALDRAASKVLSTGDPVDLENVVQIEGRAR